MAIWIHYLSTFDSYIFLKTFCNVIAQHKQTQKDERWKSSQVVKSILIDYYETSCLLEINLHKQYLEMDFLTVTKHYENERAVCWVCFCGKNADNTKESDQGSLGLGVVSPVSRCCTTLSPYLPHRRKPLPTSDIGK